MGVISWNQAVDIGGGRGRLAPEAAASLARVDVDMRSTFGRAADINEAWRSPEDADRNYAAYQAYLRDPKRNPWAPIALPGDKSVHCFGYAVDTDDTSNAQMRIWNEHGWFWTVYRDGKLVERWHLEYFRDRDKHRNDPAYSNAKPFEEDDMFSDNDRKLLEEVRDRLRGDKNRPYDMLQSIESISGEARDRLRGPGSRPYDMLQSIEGAALETQLRVRGPLDQPYDMLQGIMGQVGGRVTEVQIDDEQAAVIAAAAVGGLAALLQSNQEALLAQLRTLPAETIATLKAAL